MGKVYTFFSDQNGAKTILFGTAHTYVAYIREYPPPPDKRGSLAPDNINLKRPLTTSPVIAHDL